MQKPARVAIQGDEEKGWEVTLIFLPYEGASWNREENKVFEYWNEVVRYLGSFDVVEWTFKGNRKEGE